MKLSAILLFCCVIYYIDAQYCTGSTFKDILAKCSTVNEATPDDIEDFLSERKAATENAACFRGCILQECNVMDAVGDFDHNIYKEYLQLFSGGDADKQIFMESVFENCFKLQKVEGRVCDTAENFMDCLYTTNCNNCGWNFHNL